MHITRRLPLYLPRNTLRRAQPSREIRMRTIQLGRVNFFDIRRFKTEHTFVRGELVPCSTGLVERPRHSARDFGGLPFFERTLCVRRGTGDRGVGAEGARDVALRGGMERYGGTGYGEDIFWVY